MFASIMNVDESNNINIILNPQKGKWKQDPAGPMQATARMVKKQIYNVGLH